MKSLAPIFILALFCTGCANKYSVHKASYDFEATEGRPDYSSLNFWAAHPWKKDPSDSIPYPLKQQIRDSAVDVFFIHPTMYTGPRIKGSMNKPVDDPFHNAKTDYSTILYQASVFNQHARVFAPRYREAHISSYFMNDREKALKAFDTAYSDLEAAFCFYLEHYNKGRPIIIASHSQGTTHAVKLLNEFFSDQGLKQRLVVAYLIGMGVPLETMEDFEPCRDSLQTGCMVGWRTFRKGYRPFYVKDEKGPHLSTNPLTWRIDSTYAPRSLNHGSILRKFHKVYTGTTDAVVRGGIIWVSRPKFPWSFAYFTKNYHIGDINLYYINLRKNVEARIRAYGLK